MNKTTDIEAYIANIPLAARPNFTKLRRLVKAHAPNTREVVSHGILGYKVDERRARVFISGWKDHTAIYPLPKDEALRKELRPYIKGKGTLWFKNGEPLPEALIERTVQSLLRT